MALLLQGALAPLAGAVAKTTAPVAEHGQAANSGPPIEDDVPTVVPTESGHLQGQMSSKFKIDDSNPEASVPSNKVRDQNPLEFGYLLQDLLDRAEQARKVKDYGSLVLYYRAVAKAVPDNAKGWSKLCEAYELAGDLERAIRACKYALERPAVELQDFMRYIHLSAGKAYALTTTEMTDVRAALDHLVKVKAPEVAVNHLRCEVGVKIKDVPLLESCTAALARLAPNDPKTVVFQWSLAMQKGQRTEAERLIERAKQTGVVQASIDSMEEVTSSLGRFGRTIRGALVGLMALLGVLGGFVVWNVRRRGTRSV